MQLRLLSSALLGACLFACGDGDHPSSAGATTPSPPDDVLAKDAGVNDTGQLLPPSVPSCKLGDPVLTGPKLSAFSGAGELNAYLEAISSHCVPPPSTSPTFADAGAQAASPTNAGAAPAADNESITNNQENGVDEGDIVKNVGDFLLILRQGRLYAVNVATAGRPLLTDSIRVAATDQLNVGVWYDELLVHGDLLFVIGYRYRVALAGQGTDVSFAGASGATEIDVFRLSGGKLARLSQSFIESWDYFSGTNYASRLIDGQLVLYMPSSAIRGQRLESAEQRYVGIPAIPRLLRYDLSREQFEVDRPLFTAEDVQRPLAGVQQPTFHSVVRCNVAAGGSLDCATKAVLGNYSRDFYVSQKRVYLWTTGRVVAIGLDAWSVAAHQVSGNPATQFAFKELNETLYVATAGGTSSNNPRLSMWKLPLSAFDQQGEQELDPARTVLLSRNASLGYVAAERFVGSVYIADFEHYGNEPRQSSRRIMYDVASPNAARVEESTVSYRRIEPLGPNRALLVGNSVASTAAGKAALQLEIWTLQGAPVRASTFALEGLAQGESRSHGFFYKALDGDHGTFGLPVLTSAGGEASYWYAPGASNIAFLNVATDHTLSTLGVVSTGMAGTRCETSCVDWYGNTRPIFLRDRTFALMGSELVEVTLRPQTVELGSRALLTF